MDNISIPFDEVLMYPSIYQKKIPDLQKALVEQAKKRGKKVGMSDPSTDYSVGKSGELRVVFELCGCYDLLVIPPDEWELVSLTVMDEESQGRFVKLLAEAAKSCPDNEFYGDVCGVVDCYAKVIDGKFLNFVCGDDSGYIELKDTKEVLH